MCLYITAVASVSAMFPISRCHECGIVIQPMDANSLFIQSEMLSFEEFANMGT